MIYIITGGNSFIGIALCNCLSAESHDIILVCREHSTCALQESNHVRIVRYKGLSDMLTVAKYVDFADVFVHLAWNGTRGASRNDSEAQQKNVEDSMLALQTAKDLGCKLFVEAGSQAEHGFINTVFDEKTFCHPDSEYGKAKLEFGERATKFCKTVGMKFLHLRYVSIFGKHDYSQSLIMSCIDKMLRNEDIELSSCEQNWNYLDVNDAARQTYLLTKYALETPKFKSEIFLIGSHDTRKLRSFVEEMRILTHTHSNLHFGEYHPLDTVSLNPCILKTEGATGGFIASRTFGQVVTEIIKDFKK